jgi:release factor glutamine methyltransferase
MKNSKALFQDFVSRLKSPEQEEERYAIAYLIFDHFFNLTRADILLNKSISWNAEDQDCLEDCLARLNRNEPVQYITGVAYFLGNVFRVNKHVLIPRPETEELVQAVVSELSGRRSSEVTILDIGTGSGCIPITLSQMVKNARVYASDISEEALAVAVKNAQRLNARVHFFRHDILEENIPLADLDVVISNPPYIGREEANEMSRNVTDYEPHTALFVPGDDPLIFYRAIATKSFAVLKRGGFCVVEINRKYGMDVQQLFAASGFDPIQVLCDISANDRIVKAFKAV